MKFIEHFKKFMVLENPITSNSFEGICLTGIPIQVRHNPVFPKHSLPLDGLIVKSYADSILPCRILKFEFFKNNFGKEVTYPYGNASIILEKTDQVYEDLIKYNDVLYVKILKEDQE